MDASTSVCGDLLGGMLRCRSGTEVLSVVLMIFRTFPKEKYHVRCRPYQLRANVSLMVHGLQEPTFRSPPPQEDEKMQHLPRLPRQLPLRSTEEKK